jgi:hypothetical protein
MVRMGILPADGKTPSPEEMRKAAEAMRLYPDIDMPLEMMIRRMVSLMFIEISAFHTFAWAEEVLSDDDLVAESKTAVELVRCIRADETPHVDYLRTSLSEMRDRTFVGASGKTYAGTEVIQKFWDTALELSLGVNRQNFIKQQIDEIEHALEGNKRRAQILEGFYALGTEKVA